MEAPSSPPPPYPGSDDESPPYSPPSAGILTPTSAASPSFPPPTTTFAAPTEEQQRLADMAAIDAHHREGTFAKARLLTRASELSKFADESQQRRIGTQARLVDVLQQREVAELERLVAMTRERYHAPGAKQEAERRLMEHIRGNETAEERKARKLREKRQRQKKAKREAEKAKKKAARGNGGQEEEGGGDDDSSDDDDVEMMDVDIDGERACEFDAQLDKMLGVLPAVEGAVDAEGSGDDNGPDDDDKKKKKSKAKGKKDKNKGKGKELEPAPQVEPSSTIPATTPHAFRAPPRRFPPPSVSPGAWAFNSPEFGRYDATIEEHMERLERIAQAALAIEELSNMPVKDDASLPHGGVPFSLKAEKLRRTLAQLDDTPISSSSRNKKERLGALVEDPKEESYGDDDGHDDENALTTPALVELLDASMRKKGIKVPSRDRDDKGDETHIADDDGIRVYESVDQNERRGSTGSGSTTSSRTMREESPEQEAADSHPVETDDKPAVPSTSPLDTTALTTTLSQVEQKTATPPQGEQKTAQVCRRIWADLDDEDEMQPEEYERIAQEEREKPSRMRESLAMSGQKATPAMPDKNKVDLTGQPKASREVATISKTGQQSKQAKQGEKVDTFTKRAASVLLSTPMGKIRKTPRDDAAQAKSAKKVEPDTTVDQSKTTTQITAVDESKTTTQVTAVDESSKTTQATAVAQPEKTTQVTAVDQSKTTKQVTAVDQPKATTQATAIEQSKKTTQATAVNQPKKTTKATVVEPKKTKPSGPVQPSKPAGASEIQNVQRRLTAEQLMQADTAITHVVVSSKSAEAKVQSSKQTLEAKKETASQSKPKPNPKVKVVLPKVVLPKPAPKVGKMPVALPKPAQAEKVEAPQAKPQDTKKEIPQSKTSLKVEGTAAAQSKPSQEAKVVTTAPKPVTYSGKAAPQPAPTSEVKSTMTVLKRPTPNVDKKAAHTKTEKKAVSQPEPTRETIKTASQLKPTQETKKTIVPQTSKIEQKATSQPKTTTQAEKAPQQPKPTLEVRQMTVPQPKPGPKVEQKTAPQPKTITQAEKAPRQPKSTPEARQTTAPQPKSGPKVEQKADAPQPKTSPKVEQKAAPKPSPKVEQKAAPQPKPTPKIEQKAAPQPKSTPKMVQKAAPQPKPSPKVEQKAAPKPSHKVEQKAAPQPKPSPKIEQRASPQLKTPKTEQKAIPQSKQAAEIQKTIVTQPKSTLVAEKKATPQPKSTLEANKTVPQKASPEPKPAPETTQKAVPESRQTAKVLRIVGPTCDLSGKVMQRPQAQHSKLAGAAQSRSVPQSKQVSTVDKRTPVPRPAVATRSGYWPAQQVANTGGVDRRRGISQPKAPAQHVSTSAPASTRSQFTSAQPTISARQHQHQPQPATGTAQHRPAAQFVDSHTQTVYRPGVLLSAIVKGHGGATLPQCPKASDEDEDDNDGKGVIELPKDDHEYEGLQWATRESIRDQWTTVTRRSRKPEVVKGGKAMESPTLVMPEPIRGRQTTMGPKGTPPTATKVAPTSAARSPCSKSALRRGRQAGNRRLAVSQAAVGPTADNNNSTSPVEPAGPSAERAQQG